MLNDVLGTINRGNPCESGLCTLCRADCKGRCETWLSSLLGRKMLYPRDFGMITAGSNNTNPIGVSYNALRINGRNYGANSLPKDITNSGDDCIFPNVNLETEFGKEIKTKVKLPLMSGALGSTLIAEKYWSSFATGAALVGIPIVIGENVVGIDKRAEFKNGKIIKAPELDKRINTYLRYYDGFGAIIIQMNVEDTRNGVAEYIIEKFGEDVIIELKWGQGAKDIGGEIQVTTLAYAQFLKNRGYIIDPDPTKEEVKEAYKHGSVKSFARHSRLGFTNLNSVDKVKEQFMDTINYLRSLGYKRITLKTGAYGLEALAMAIKFSSEARLDLLTIDGSGGGTGMSPWNMMESWGIPSLYLHSKAFEYADLLSKSGENVVDLSFAGGLAREDQIFKALALGAPYTKLICMGRALMIPGFLGANIEGVLKPESKTAVYGNWDQLAEVVLNRGRSPEEIFAGYFDIQKKLGKDEIKNIPYGAIALWTLIDKLGAGLQQFMAGSRKFNISDISRNDILSCNRETEDVTKIPYLIDYQDDIAKEILNNSH